jgi:DNA-binding response OmpR family regulator
VFQGKVLVVDDEVYILHILDFSLGAEGFEVITAADGEQALAKARAERPDLIVMDIMMPRLDGYETCRRLKSYPETREIPVLLLTARGREEDRQKGIDCGADDYITKPFSPNKLIRRVSGILGIKS